MLRVVLDTNVLVSAIISNGKSRELLMRGLENQFRIITSDLILKELVTVLARPKFKTSKEEKRKIFLALERTADVVSVKSTLLVVKDDFKDNMVIETAFDGNADLIVTGDSHLLALEVFKGIKIIAVEKMLGLLREDNP